MSEEDLITDIRLFPRSEYYTRFVGTTAFAMDNPAYWGTYHRSESTRFFHEAGGRKNVQFLSNCLKKPAKTNSFSAHTGGVASPLSNEDYREAITLKRYVSQSNTNVRDELLRYKCQMAEIVVSSFEKVTDSNTQEIKRKGRRKIYDTRPIVFYENNYPCVLIKLPVLNPTEAETEAAKYWSEHPKPFQRLLLASFIAFLNVEAMKAGIPIEMVIRSSFGHNLPSICETDNTFRINVGVVPEAYAELIGKALNKLNQMIEKITDENSLETPFDDDFLNKVRHYNSTKLKKAIDENSRYKILRGTKDYEKAAESDNAFERLYAAFTEINTKKGLKGSSRFVPVRLKGKTIWEAIREAGDSMGKSVLAECFRENKTVDWFADLVMEAMLNDKQKKFPIEFALFKLLKHLKYEDTATMDYKKIHRDLKKPKRKFDNLSFKPLYKNDPEFSRVTDMLFEALCEDRPDKAIYYGLEKAGADFFSTYRGSRTENLQEEPDYGSSSEFSDDFSVVVESKKSGKKCTVTEEFHASHAKLRVCSGMKAIVLAQYGALFYLRENGAKKSFRQDIQQMYYEVEDALKMVHQDGSKKLVENKVSADLEASILHYDLNHCNAANAADNITLSKKLDEFTPSVVILDYTSSTYDEIKEALERCFIRPEVSLVIMVDSGLKNNQGGLDFNPYGEVRVWARDSKTRNNILEKMEQGLSKLDKLPPETHEIVRTCKRRGLAVSLYGFFQTDKARFQPVEPTEKPKQSSKLSR